MKVIILCDGTGTRLKMDYINDFFQNRKVFTSNLTQTETQYLHHTAERSKTIEI